MDRASQELSKVSQQLNGQLINSLNTTFDCFDQNLAEITKHLSGTISEVDATINRMPHMIEASYDGLEKTFGNMQTNLESMIHALDIMQRNLQRWADKMGNPVVNGEV
jgi:DNA anti-recombination protein RmuC